VTRPDRPPVRARSGRRPLPPLLFLLVLAIIAGAVWWNVFRDESAKSASQAAACVSAQKAPPSLDPKTVSIRVLNATDEAGLAQKVADELKKRGFTIAEVANDPTERKVTGVGEIRHGARGAEAAAFLGVLLPSGGDYLDTRATAQVDFVLGPDFVFPDSLAGPEAVAAALTSAAGASSVCGTPAPASPTAVVGSTAPSGSAASSSPAGSSPASSTAP
jgi:LytR cell envelope-related transcriptional attenuator